MSAVTVAASGVFEVPVMDQRRPAGWNGAWSAGQWEAVDSGLSTWRWSCAACAQRSFATFATEAEAERWLAEHEHRHHGGPAVEREPLGRLDPAGNRNGRRLSDHESVGGGDGTSEGATSAQPSPEPVYERLQPGQPGRGMAMSDRECPQNLTRAAGDAISGPLGEKSGADHRTGSGDLS